MRLQKYLATAGVASRRKAEEYILEGKVTVNGEVITTLGTIVSEDDCITYNGKLVKLEEEHVYYILNKPVGYVTTASDEKDRATVIDLMKGVEKRVFPVGRLDYTTSGLLIMTNDGDLTYTLTHPKHQVNKTYEAKVKGFVKPDTIEQLKNGVMIDGRKTARAGVKVLSTNTNTTLLSITIHEGRNRQVRKMCSVVGHEVLTLQRVSVGKLTLTGLKVGEYRKLTPEEVNYLKQ
ncbi:MAG: pseudouridine synthase [Cellulosilyticaceae bacterium]